ncbi:MAG: TonB-dependent receptor plug domain-containing protein [Betaproteobacteria bacterium]|uniref:TonB-dependent receptor plug domain-containing protein n=1 Tax=Candidatus Proximibacter danicus TaxID=2954365 RepID=A0A9D7K4I9_9PROT|nr:TonB-dependent receptor plug domain-containing protein [Candidatus Proximibacter danicus]
MLAGPAEPPTTLGSHRHGTSQAEAPNDRPPCHPERPCSTAKDIEALGGLTVGEVIRKLPGIEAGAHTGDGSPSAKARGMGRDAVQFLVDGERPRPTRATR